MNTTSVSTTPPRHHPRGQRSTSGQSPALTILIVGAMVLASGCTSVSLARSGSEVDPVSLSSTYGNGSAGLGSDVLDELVAETAGGPVTVRTPFVAPVTDDEDGDAVKRVRAGEADISVVRSDALEGAGATSMAALTAPFVVTNEAQASKIAADPISADLMAGLDKVGLVGLRLVPGGLRHPVGFNAALLGPADYAGNTINSRYGPGVERIITALGGRPDHSVNAARSQLVGSGVLRGIELSFLQSGAADLPAVFTSNVTLYTKFDVLVIRKTTFDTLSAAQQRALASSADKAISVALAGRRGEDQLLKEWCGGVASSAVVASVDVVRQLQGALKPVVDRLRTDPATARALDRFSVLHEGTTDPTGATCGTSSPSEAAYRVTPVGDQTIMDGTWRTGATEQEILAAGISREKARNNAGVWTVKVTQGKGTWSQPNGQPCRGDFTFAGNKVTLDMPLTYDNLCGGLATGSYDRQGDTITFQWTADLYDSVVLDNVLLKRFVKVG